MRRAVLILVAAVALVVPAASSAAVASGFSGDQSTGEMYDISRVAAANPERDPPPPPGLRAELEQGGYSYVGGVRSQGSVVYFSKRGKLQVKAAMRTKSRNAALLLVIAVRSMGDKRQELEAAFGTPGHKARIVGVETWRRYAVFSLVYVKR